jgi:hypothetical protein
MRASRFLLAALLSASAFASDQPAFRPLLFAAEGVSKILEYDSAGKVVWEYPAEMARDAWRLPNGNTLFCYNLDYDSRRNDGVSGVMEVTRAGKVVFDFRTTGQVFSCQRLAQGQTLIGAASQGKLLIADSVGRIVREIRVRNTPGHSCMRNARQLATGHFLVAEESAKAVREYDPEGNLVQEFKTGFSPYSAVRLDSGNTIICGQKSIIELDPAGRETWSLDARELPAAIGVRWFAGMQVLPGGNLLLCNAGGSIGFVEIARDKRVVWQSGTGLPIGHGIQALGARGLPLE